MHWMPGEEWWNCFEQVRFGWWISLINKLGKAASSSSLHMYYTANCLSRNRAINELDSFERKRKLEYKLTNYQWLCRHPKGNCRLNLW
ncbi:hypothetical protein MLD38_028034 [Melastoma candidum]|uniref:Uncharacterized protein n=1 Tax=Melastoma candidum TaxID=119954 RepID=A0ACB9N242_9MYRT|nr:hypothetical protein MLD38_028034 [Melastoma candidum]